MTTVISVEEASRIGEARRAAAAISASLELRDELAGRVALVVNELGTNLVKHARGGAILMRPIDDGEERGVELVGVDKGPGMDVAQCLEDGFSTAGSRGAGLGAIRRASAVFDAWSSPSGSYVLGRVTHGVSSTGVASGVVSTPYPGESICGDGWVLQRDGAKVVAAVVDGLGHGPLAAEASTTFAKALRRESELAPAAVIERAHAALRATRGAAAAVVRFDARGGALEHAGVGNVAVTLAGLDGATQSCVSQHGIVGAQMRRVSQASHALAPRALVVLCSDGITTSWRFDRHPGLVARHPALIASVLWAMHRRGRDDATVLVCRAEDGARGAEA